MYSTVTIKGQIVIPAKIRKKIGLKKGTRVSIEERNGDIIIHAATPAFYDRSFGVLKGSGVTKALLTSRKADRERENRHTKGSR